MTRREFARTVAAGLALPVVAGRWVSASAVGGVRLGVQSYSFREIAKVGSADALGIVISSMKACGVDECELWSPQIELAPPVPRATGPEQEKGRDALRAWRRATKLDYYENIRKTFAAAGMTVYAYNYSFLDYFTDDEIELGFNAARALGAEVITASTTVTMARRVVPFAEKHKMAVAMHNHSQVDEPNEFATPKSFETALAMSPLYRMNLDIGHFTAADYNALDFLQSHRDRITNLHLKDRKKHQGANVPWGTGDTPIKEALAWLKQNKSPIRAYVEYEYPGTKGALAEVQSCVDYAKRALTT